MRPNVQIRSNRAQDWALVILAIWLFISPWVLQFGSTTSTAAGGAAAGGVGHAAWNAWILGIILFLVAISAVTRMQVSQEWIALVLGAWIFVAPWALGFVSVPKASWDHWIVGAIVFLIALASLSMLRTVPTVGGVNSPRTREQPPT
jgi:hypothetical protein